MKKPARFFCLLLAGCIGLGLLAGCGGLRLLPDAESQTTNSAQSTAPGPENTAGAGEGSPAAPGEESLTGTGPDGPVSAGTESPAGAGTEAGMAGTGGQPLTEEEQAYWLRQAELLAKRLAERSFSQEELGRSREQLDPAVLERFAYSLAFLQEDPDEAYLLAAAPELSADGRTCRLPYDRLCEVLRHCFGCSDEEIAKIEFSHYDPAENCLVTPLEVGHYEYFSITGMEAAFTGEDTIQLQLALWGGLYWPDPVDHGRYCMTLRLKKEDGQAYLQFESLLAGA